MVPGDNEEFDENIRPDEIGLTNRSGSLMQASTLIDLDSQVSIGCVGALIACLQRRRASEYLQNDLDAQAVYRIRTIEMFSFHKTMYGSASVSLLHLTYRRFVNADTLASLQIIMPETHPNVFNQGPGATGSKESHSIFGLFHTYARTPQGRSRLRQMFLRPSLDKEAIETRLRCIAVLSRPDNHSIIGRLSKSLNKVKNLHNTMTMLRRGTEAGKKHGSFKSGAWSTLLEFCYYAIDIVDSLHEVVGVEQLLLCSQVSETVDKFRLKQIGRIIFEVVDLELSTEQHRTVVKRGVDEHLDAIKDVYDGMDELLSQVAVDVARGIPLGIECRINVIFFPQLGFHITTPLSETTMQPLWDGDRLWERMFTTKNTAYFKEEKTRRMDQEIGDLWANICDIEIELVYDLAQQILQDHQVLLASSDILGELDCMLALAHGAIAHKLVRPHIVDSNIIEITGGRHILQDMVVPSFVPNDTTLRGGDCTDEAYTQYPSMTILTGPNYSGKSVYQNQVAIIIYMAQVGCFVPAEHCTLGITDKILTRISTTETASKPHSAFMIDLQQVGLALNVCTPRSLIVIDEFGKGTDTCDGAGLMAGVLQHIVELGTETPKVLAATHFHEIFGLGLFDEATEPGLRHAHMQVRVDRNHALTEVKGKNKQKRGFAQPAEEVTYLYQLQPGRSTLSYGTQCARMNAIPAPIVKRAADLADAIAKGVDLVAMCSGLSEVEMRDLMLAERTGRRFLGEDFDQDLVEGDEGWADVLDGILAEGVEENGDGQEIMSCDGVTVTEYTTTGES